MRRLMLTLAVVFGAAVIDLEAQGHGAPAPPHEKASPAPKTAGTPAPPPDVATVIARINTRVATEITDLRSSRRAAQPAAPARRSPAPRAASRAVSTPARIELDWRQPLLVWPEELLRPDRSDAPSPR